MATHEVVMIDRDPWTPISEKPPEGEYVFLLGYFGDDVRHKDSARYHNRIVVGCWEADDPNYPDWCYIPAHHCDVPQEVTHWAPLLPEPKDV